MRRAVAVSVGAALLAAGVAGGFVVARVLDKSDDVAGFASFEDRICDGMDRALRAEATDWNDGGGPEALGDAFNAVHDATEPDIVNEAHPVIVEVDEKLHRADDRYDEGKDESGDRLTQHAYEALGTFCYAQNHLSGQAEAVVTNTPS